MKKPISKRMKQFLATRRAWSNLECAALKLMPHIYTEKMCEKVAAYGDWLSEVVLDGEAVLNGQYNLARGGKNDVHDTSTRNKRLV